MGIRPHTSCTRLQQSITVRNRLCSLLSILRSLSRSPSMPRSYRRCGIGSTFGSQMQSRDKSTPFDLPWTSFFVSCSDFICQRGCHAMLGSLIHLRLPVSDRIQPIFFADNLGITKVVFNSLPLELLDESVVSLQQYNAQPS